MSIKSEEEWAERAAAFLKHKLQDCEVTYAELAKRLKKHGFKEKPKPRSPLGSNGGHSRPRGFWPCLRRWNWTA